MSTLGFFAGRYLVCSNDILIGFVLVGAVPGAMASNVISYLARADVAYSVLMTTSATLLAPLLTPAITKALVGASIEVPFWSMSWQVFWMTVIPIVLGISIRRFARRWVEPLEPLSSALASLAIVVICAYIHR
jgi:BASS family bile acid:Na+ symporter